MEIIPITEPSLSLRSYLVGDPISGQAAVIDPFPDPSLFVEAAKQRGFTIGAIIETHVHADFLSGSLELQQALPNHPNIYASAAGGEKWLPVYANHQIQDGEEISLGQGVLKAYHTPGHTPEHLVWLLKEKGIPQALFSGDLLFSGGVGRPDLLGGDFVDQLIEQLHRSLFNVLSQWPDELKVYPAHGAGSWCGHTASDKPSTTLGEERRSNPYLQTTSFPKWRERLMTNLPNPPPTVAFVKQRNVKRNEIISLPELLKTIPSDWNNETVVDLRSLEEFSAGHYPHAIHLPQGHILSTFAPWVIPIERPVHVTLAKEGDWTGVKLLQNLGFAIAKAALWQISDLAEKTSLVKVTEANNENLYVLDVRRPDEWQEGHIPWAKYIELKDLAKDIEKVPKDRLIYTICRSGQRASTAASLLARAGCQEVANIKGGMQAWIQARLPVTQK